MRDGDSSIGWASFGGIAATSTMFADLYSELAPHPWRAPLVASEDAYSLFHARSSAMGWLTEGGKDAACGCWGMNDAGQDPHDELWLGPAQPRTTFGILAEWSLDALGWLAAFLADASSRHGVGTPLMLTASRYGWMSSQLNACPEACSRRGASSPIRVRCSATTPTRRQHHSGTAFDSDSTNAIAATPQRAEQATAGHPPHH